jgi:hypothetical protein
VGESLAALAGQIWAGEEPMGLSHISACLCVVAGDIARQARAEAEGHEPDRDALTREFGNLVLSAFRWAGHLGLRPEECIQAAVVAQQRYRSERCCESVIGSEAAGFGVFSAGGCVPRRPERAVTRDEDARYVKAEGDRG